MILLLSNNIKNKIKVQKLKKEPHIGSFLFMKATLQIT